MARMLLISVLAVLSTGCLVSGATVTYDWYTTTSTTKTTTNSPEAKPSPGYTCTSHADCYPTTTTFCDLYGTLTCMDKKLPGKMCGGDVECQSDYCPQIMATIPRVCTIVPSKKAALSCGCTAHTDCFAVPNSYCDLLVTRTCVAKKFPGKMCDGDVECQSDYCPQILPTIPRVCTNVPVKKLLT